MDRLSSEDRSRLMGKVRGRDTSPEIAVRKLAHALGYRFRLHCRNLPGSPDLVFSGRRKVIFVHGCFWHRHPGCKLASTPKTRAEFWQAKFVRNVERDADVERRLRADGWGVLTVWQCETKNIETLTTTLCDFLGPSGAAPCVKEERLRNR